MSKLVAETTDKRAERAVRKLTAWSLLAGLFLLMAMAGPYYAGRIYTADDLGGFHLPMRAFYAEQLARGEPYDWMPGLFSGYYFTGEGQSGVYHPLHQILYRFLSLRAALGLEYLLSYPLMMLGTWLWLKRLLGRGDAAMFGAMLFTFSSFNLLHFIHPNGVAIVAHIPWLLWAIDVVLVDSRRRRVALAAAMIALLTGSELLLGYPQYVWFSLLAEGSYVLFLLATRGRRPRTGCAALATCRDCVAYAERTLPRVVIAKLIGLLFGGIQLLPTLDAWLNSTRISANADFTAWGSLYPGNLAQLIAPYLLGSGIFGDNTHELGMYLGAGPLMLIVWMMVRRKELGSLTPLAWAMVGFGLLTLLLAFGRYSFLHRILEWMPMLRMFRFSCRYLVLFQLAAAVSAAIGFLLLTRESRLAAKENAEDTGHRDRRARLISWIDFEPFFGIVVVSVVMAALGIGFLRESCHVSAIAVLAGPVLLTAAAILIVLATRGYSSALVGLILLTAFDLGWYGLNYSIYPSNAVLENYVASAQVPPGKPEGRVVGAMIPFDQQGLRTCDLMTMSGWNRADGYAGLEPDRKLDYHFVPALRAACVRWVQRNPSTASIAGLKPRDDRWLEVPDPLPRFRLVTQARASDDPAADIASICLETTALCEVPLCLPFSKPGKVALVEEHPGRFAIDVDCPAPQLLVVAESYHPGWRASIDGVSLDIYRVNGDFMGCVVGPGKRRVLLNFQPESLTRGRLISYLGLGMISLCFLGVSASPKSRTMQENPT